MPREINMLIWYIIVEPPHIESFFGRICIGWCPSANIHTSTNEDIFLCTQKWWLWKTNQNSKSYSANCQFSMDSFLFHPNLDCIFIDINFSVQQYWTLDTCIFYHSYNLSVFKILGWFFTTFQMGKHGLIFWQTYCNVFFFYKLLN